AAPCRGGLRQRQRRSTASVLQPSPCCGVHARLGSRQERQMGLLDVINGMRNGPRGQPVPSQGGGGMSPITMAILALLAYKGIKHLGNRAPSPGIAPSQAPAGNPFNRTAESGGAM